MTGLPLSSSLKQNICMKFGKPGASVKNHTLYHCSSALRVGCRTIILGTASQDTCEMPTLPPPSNPMTHLTVFPGKWTGLHEGMQNSSPLSLLLPLSSLSRFPALNFRLQAP